MRNTNYDKASIKKALNNTKEKRLELEQKVAEARVMFKDANQKLQMASDELKTYYTEIATLNQCRKKRRAISLI